MKRFPLLTLALCATSTFLSAAPRVVLSTGSLVPESKIDFVFEKPVVPAAAVGTTTENSWVVIAPPLDGKLRWKTPEIAEWVEGALPKIATTYTFSVAKDRAYL
ncbi:MAG: hypothetical protein KDN05_11600, partial [Verrucomicrobiae bacterium]|nr:hypothetical protein [Verrucomicrobiae bacterium]